MEKLNFEQMECVNGGIDSGCGWAIAGEIVSCFSAVAIGNVAGLCWWLAGQATALGGLVASCRG